MNTDSPIIEIQNLSRRYGKLDAVNGLSLKVRAGKCYGFFGRNGAGKTTTIKCLLNLLRPNSGTARVFGLDPQKNEVAVKSRLAYVPDMVAFYPWMTVRDTLEYLASFRKHWNSDIENDLISRFHLDPKQKTSHLSKGQRTQLALIGAICPEPELLVLDEPTSGLDPIVRREFIETVIGAYQSGDPGRRTVFVSTHLISEFEGLIDEFTIIEQGRELLTMEADAARDRFKKIRVRFPQELKLDLPAALKVKRAGREVEILANGNSEQLLALLKSHQPEELKIESLSLEEIFVASDLLKKCERMNPLVKKEIRLLLPSFIVAVLLALVQAITRPYDFYVASLLFFGLTIMALTTIGRESSLNTFSAMLAQPAERVWIWQTKLSVLAVAFLIVFVVWLAAFGIAFMNSDVDASDKASSYNLFISICLVGAATFTGGLWTTLLLRQVAGAFWLTLSVPAVLAGLTMGFLLASHSDNAISPVLCVVLGIYSVGGFLFARWLFFRAQDVGWSGGNIELPEWKFFARPENAVSLRNRKPVFALFKKEFQLQQGVFMGVVGLLALHIGIIVLRTYHHFANNSAGVVLTSIFWLLWLVIPVVVGSLAVAEERRLGVIEGQLCLPVSRRVQFSIKVFSTLILAVFLGGVMPVLVETAGVGLGAKSIFGDDLPPNSRELLLFQLGLGAFVAWLALVSFFASTLAKTFLQAIGFAIVTFTGWVMLISGFAVSHRLFYGSFPTNSFLPLVISLPTIIATMLWLAYLNFKNFRDGWPLWQRNLLGIGGALVFTAASSAAIYNRAWEVFEPVEPAHGPAKLTLVNPSTLKIAQYNNLLVRLPDGRVWFDELGDSPYDYGSVRWKYMWQMLAHPLPESIGPQQFLAGSNWVAATTEGMFFHWDDRGEHFGATDFMETVGIQPDGMLWISEKHPQNKWTAGTLQRFGTETNWRQVAQGNTSVVLLKSDGTLWRWGCLTNELHQWPGLRAFTPYQISTNTDWQELFTMNRIFVRQTNGCVWRLDANWKKGIEIDELVRETNYDEIVSQTASSAGEQSTAFVRSNGTLWVLNRYWDEVKGGRMMGSGVLQVGKENDWRAVAVSYHMMVALKADGSLWQWNFQNRPAAKSVNTPPTRLGIHDDWIAITGRYGNVIALAADGSLWLWPDRQYYDYGALLKLPKQPQLLGNVFGKAD